jgi:predicted RNA-binding Zn-ribbon protein involved in translation (DUF1610 family)
MKSIVFESNDIIYCEDCDCKLTVKDNGIESFCPLCGKIYNSDLDVTKHKLVFMSDVDKHDAAAPIINMVKYTAETKNKDKDLPDDKLLKQPGVTILEEIDNN